MIETLFSDAKYIFMGKLKFVLGSPRLHSLSTPLSTHFSPYALLILPMMELRNI